MTRFTLSTFLLALLASVTGFSAEPPKEAETAKAELILPRFAIDKTSFKQHPGLEEAINGVPSLKAEDAMFSWDNSFKTRVTFDPAKADIGDIARAVAAVPVSDAQKKNPAAVLLVFTALPRDAERAFTEEQSVKAWKSLEGVAGIDLSASKKRTGKSGVFRIVLDDKGGAKLAAIVAAIKSAGIEFQAR